MVTHLVGAVEAVGDIEGYNTYHQKYSEHDDIDNQAPAFQFLFFHENTSIIYIIVLKVRKFRLPVITLCERFMNFMKINYKSGEIWNDLHFLPQIL